MADTRGRWAWDVPGFEPPQPVVGAAAGMPLAPPTAMPRAPPTAMVARAAGADGAVVPVADRLDQLADSVQVCARFAPAVWM